MSENKENIYLLGNKIVALMKRHEEFSGEIKELRQEINALLDAEEKEGSIVVAKSIIESTPEIFDLSESEEEQSKLLNEIENQNIDNISDGSSFPKVEPEANMKKAEPVFNKPFQDNSKIDKFSNSSVLEKYKTTQEKIQDEEKVVVNKAASSFNIEKFIGQNIFPIVGVVILLIGMAIGVKWSIDNNLISPKTRIGFGYLMSIGLLGFGIWFKKKYEFYSAILVSGAIASLYFITYFAYKPYGFFKAEAAFPLMVLFTIFAVIAAINYNRQVIAHIGLVGAYAIPFLLSNDSGQVVILFSYMTIINIGILVLAFKKYWKPLYYSSFFFTWLIYGSWYCTKYSQSVDFEIALLFLSIFFTTFYIVFLAYKLLKKEAFNQSDIVLLLINSFVFYGIGYSIIESELLGAQFLGLYTVFNALIHFVVSVILYRKNLVDKNLFYFTSGLVLIFLTIAVPVQLDGRWVTLLWVGEAALLFGIGRKKDVGFYEKIAYILMVIAFVSLVQDWQTVYDTYIPSQPETRITPIFNINFLTSILFVAAFVYINILFYSKKYIVSSLGIETQKTLLGFCISVMLGVVIYFSFFLEISNYLVAKSKDLVLLVDEVSPRNNLDYYNYKWVWLINYSILFASAFSFANIKKFKNEKLGGVSIALNSFALFVFLAYSLYFISELRHTYIYQLNTKSLYVDNYKILIRYISYAFVLLTYYSVYKQIRQDYFKSILSRLKIFFDFFVATSLLWLASSELFACIDMLTNTKPDKLGLSILWGIYALSLVVYGLWKSKKHLRITAIVLFVITTLKVLLFDLADLDTISKTIVLVSLGILFLISSFLYTKFKNLIGGENEIKN